MAIRLEFAPGRVTAYLEGEIDHHNAAALRECIDEAVEKHRPETLRIDFGGVSFMDSSGVGLVIGRTSVMPVSYTHLDVYKRQADGSARESPVAWRAPARAGRSGYSRALFPLRCAWARR